MYPYSSEASPHEMESRNSSNTKHNILYQRYLFNKRRQEKNESFNNFVASVKLLAETCDYGVLKESMIRDRIVFGMNYQEMKQKLVNLGDPCLNTVIEMGRMEEYSVQQQAFIKNTTEWGTPSVRAADNFNAIADAQALRKAMKGFGTDEDTIINILTHRDNAQRQQIKQQYKTHFGKDLMEDISSETSGNFEKLLIALLTPTIDYYVGQIHDAIEGLGTDEEVLIEFLCTLSNAEIRTINHVYFQKYHRTLEDDIIGDTSGHFKRLLVSISVGGRDENVPTDREAARRDAGELLKAGELKIGTDESTFNLIFCRRSFPQIKLIDEEYKIITGHSLEDGIKSEFSGLIKDGLLAILQCAINKHEYFASRLYKSMAGIGTTDKQLIRVIVSRSEIDLIDVKQAYEKKYGKSLKSWIKGDTSGHYKHCLYALIGESRS